MVYLVKALEYMSNKTPYINVCENGINKKENNSKKQNPQHEFKYVTQTSQLKTASAS